VEYQALVDMWDHLNDIALNYLGPVKSALSEQPGWAKSRPPETTGWSIYDDNEFFSQAVGSERNRDGAGLEFIARAPAADFGGGRSNTAQPDAWDSGVEWVDSDAPWAAELSQAWNRAVEARATEVEWLHGELLRLRDALRNIVEQYDLTDERSSQDIAATEKKR